MRVIPLLFVCTEVLAAVFYKRFYFYVQFFSDLVNKPEKGKTKVIVIDNMALIFLCALIIHLALLFYCLYLMFIGQWQPGCMLLILSALESHAVKANISGVTVKSSRGYTYPTLLFKYTISTFTIFVLLNLAS